MYFSWIDVICLVIQLLRIQILGFWPITSFAESDHFSSSDQLQFLLCSGYLHASLYHFDVWPHSKHLVFLLLVSTLLFSFLGVHFFTGSPDIFFARNFLVCNACSSQVSTTVLSFLAILFSSVNHSAFTIVVKISSSFSRLTISDSHYLDNSILIIQLALLEQLHDL